MKRMISTSNDAMFDSWGWHDVSNGNTWNKWVYCHDDDWPKSTGEHDYAEVEQDGLDEYFEATCYDARDGSIYSDISFPTVEEAMDWAEDHLFHT